MGRGGKSLLCDPGSELRLGGRENRRAKIINGMEKKRKKKGPRPWLTRTLSTIDSVHVPGDLACISENSALPWVGLRPHHYTTMTAAWPSSRNLGEGWTLRERNNRWCLSCLSMHIHVSGIFHIPHISIQFEKSHTVRYITSVKLGQLS